MTTGRINQVTISATRACARVGHKGEFVIKKIILLDLCRQTSKQDESRVDSKS